MKNANDQIVINRKKRKVLCYLIILFTIATIILAACSLIYKISPIFCIITFIIEVILTNIRNKIELK